MFIGSQVISISIFIALVIVVVGYIGWCVYWYFKLKIDASQNNEDGDLAHEHRGEQRQSAAAKHAHNSPR